MNDRRSKGGKDIERDRYLCKKLGEELDRNYLEGDPVKEFTITSKDGSKKYKLTDITP
jgi:hypothetical protein